MPNIFYQYYTPVSPSIPEITAQEHALGRSLLLYGLRIFFRLSLPPEELDGLLTADKNGKPLLKGFPGIHFNISHCDGMAVCAMDTRPVGVDVEKTGYFPPVLIRRALAPEEQTLLEQRGASPALREEWFYRLWTLKEAYVKKTGTGVDVPLTDFSFCYEGAAEPYSIRCSDAKVSCFQKMLDSGHILSLCHESPGREVRLRQLLSL